MIVSNYKNVYEIIVYDYNTTVDTDIHALI